MHENDLARIVVDSAFKVHTSLGPGLLETVYQFALNHELNARGISTHRERPIPVYYDEHKLEMGFRADIVVANKVIIECKSVEALAPVHSKVLLTYLRLADMRLGLLINFNVVLIKDGIRRVVNDLKE